MPQPTAESSAESGACLSDAALNAVVGRLYRAHNWGFDMRGLIELTGARPLLPMALHTFEFWGLLNEFKMKKGALIRGVQCLEKSYCFEDYLPEGMLKEAKPLHVKATTSMKFKRVLERHASQVLQGNMLVHYFDPPPKAILAQPNVYHNSCHAAPRLAFEYGPRGASAVASRPRRSGR